MPVDGAMTMTDYEYWHIDVFRLGLLSNKFGAAWTVHIFKLQQIDVSWHNTQNGHHTEN